jgi:hypothetical protein
VGRRRAHGSAARCDATWKTSALLETRRADAARRARRRRSKQVNVARGLAPESQLIGPGT